MSQKTLYLVDLSSFIFRAYYGIRPLMTSQGVPTNAVYGVITMLLKLIRNKKPDYLVIISDSAAPTFRKELYSDYKINRLKPPEGLLPQFNFIHRYIEAYPLARIEYPGFEADDIIATIVKEYQGKKDIGEIYIATGDKDLMQLVGPKVFLYDAMKDKVITESEVRERFGVEPSQVVDILGLAGDTSDNIPGVKGIGEKTASKLIHEWGNLENLLAHADEVKGKCGENLIKYRDQAILSKKLATLHAEVPLNLDWEHFQLGEPHRQELMEICRELELFSLIEEEKSKEVPVQRQSKVNYELVLSQEDLKRWITLLASARDGFSFDTETTGLDPRRSNLVGLSFSASYGHACYIPLAHNYLGCPPQLSKKEVLEAVKPYLENPQIPKWAQNARFDRAVLAHEGIEVRGIQGDSLLASYLISPESSHNLHRLALEYLNCETLQFEDVVGKDKRFDHVNLELACRYSAEDADITYQLIDKLHPILIKEDLWGVYENIELPLIEVLYKMENHGVLVDVPYLESLSKEFGEKLLNLQRDIFNQSGFEFNVNSPKQVAEVLFVKLKLPTQRKTKTGYSTDEEVLSELAPLHPLPQTLLNYRLLNKLKTTYIDQLKNLIDPKSGRIHTHYNQTVVATGRLSSSDPNLQNIPIRSEEGRRIRGAFRAPPGYKIFSADYSQIELRLLAAFSGDKNLVRAFKEGEDIHRLTAEKIFGKSKDEVTDELRSMAKTVNFGIIYGQSPYGLSRQLGITPTEASHYINEFYRQFPSVMTFKEKVLEEAKRRGEVRTWQGRRRLVPELNSQNKNVAQNAARAAFNAVFQGSAADLIKIAMIRLDKKLPSHSKMIMQVHDELIFEVPETEIKSTTEIICKEMEEALPCEVPLKVDVEFGDTWGETQ